MGVKPTIYEKHATILSTLFSTEENGGVFGTNANIMHVQGDSFTHDDRLLYTIFFFFVNFNNFNHFRRKIYSIFQLANEHNFTVQTLKKKKKIVCQTPNRMSGSKMFYMSYSYVNFNSPNGRINENNYETITVSLLNYLVSSRSL